MTVRKVDSDLHSAIVDFAGRISGASEDSKALTYAIDHGWLTAQGDVTPEGRQLVEALLDQSGARSVFRNI
ncbi:MAG: hypothetical protein U5J99_01270 [Parvularculaceae bacterium]|nr:hypothetical protein [Parvularculaceae bacterium]